MKSLVKSLANVRAYDVRAYGVNISPTDEIGVCLFVASLFQSRAAREAHPERYVAEAARLRIEAVEWLLLWVAS